MLIIFCAERMLVVNKRLMIGLAFVAIAGCLGIFIVRADAIQYSDADYASSEIALSGDGQVIAIVGRSIAESNNPDGMAYPIDFYDTVTGRLVNSLQTIWPQSGGISLNQDGTLLAYSTARGEVNVIDTTTDNRVRSIKAGGASEAGYTRWNAVNNLVATFAGGAIFVSNGTTGQQNGNLLDLEAKGVIQGIAWNLNGSKLASTTYSDDSTSQIAQIQIWDTAEVLTLDQQPALRFDGGGSISLAWSPDDTKLASNGRGSILVYNAETGQPLEGFSTGDNKPIYQVAWSPDGTKIAAGGPQSVWIWNVATREIVESFSVEYIANSIVWSPDSQYLYHNGGTEGIYRDAISFKQIALTAIPPSAK